LKENKKYSILADHLGTPTSMYNEEGESVWERSLDSFGRIKEISKGSNSSCPFMYAGQYFDKEIGLAYNRFRYYSPEDGRYISRDPIGLASGEYGLYNYVGDPNGWIDVFGLTKSYSEAEAKEIAGEKLKETLDELDKLSKNKRKKITTVVVGVNMETGDVAVGMKNSDIHPSTICAEDLVVQKLGGDASKIKMTEAIRPRNKDVIDVCPKCQGNYPKDSFFDNVKFQ